MSVQYVKGGGGGGLLGGLGAIATLGGTLTGNPFLTTLGTGLGAANNILNGGTGVSGQGGGGTLTDIFNDILGSLKSQNPASKSGNVAKQNPSDIEYERLAKMWGPYLPTWGGNY